MIVRSTAYLQIDLWHIVLLVLPYAAPRDAVANSLPATVLPVSVQVGHTGYCCCVVKELSRIRQHNVAFIYEERLKLRRFLSRGWMLMRC